MDPFVSSWCFCNIIAEIRQPHISDGLQHIFEDPLAVSAGLFEHNSEVKELYDSDDSNLKFKVDSQSEDIFDFLKWWQFSNWQTPFNYV
jgi:hypothetical protein